jgi:hypothetical protein
MNTEEIKTEWLTKEQALKALSEGHKVAHIYFSGGEWMKQEGNVFVFEDGVRLPLGEFWKYRLHEEWDSDWFLVKK